MVAMPARVPTALPVQHSIFITKSYVILNRIRGYWQQMQRLRILGSVCTVTFPPRGTLYLRYKNPDGKTCHSKLGNSQARPLKEARNRATRLKAKIELGADPQPQATELFVTAHHIGLDAPVLFERVGAASQVDIRGINEVPKLGNIGSADPKFSCH